MNIFLIIILIILATGTYASLKGAPWVPTWKKDLDRFLKTAQIKPGQKFYDLGCGDGRLVEVAAQAGAQAVGYEISILPYLFAKFRQLTNKEKYTIKFQNLWRADLKDADILYFFLMPKIMPRLKTKLAKELKPGTRVISYVWPIPGWQEKIVDKKKGKPKIYVYII